MQCRLKFSCVALQAVATLQEMGSLSQESRRCCCSHFEICIPGTHTSFIHAELLPDVPLSTVTVPLWRPLCASMLVALGTQGPSTASWCHP